MNMNVRIETLKSKKALLIVGAAVLFVGTAAAMYFLLLAIMPQKVSRSNADTETQAPKDASAKKADTALEEGQAALSDNDPDTAVKKLSEAKELYTDAGENTKAEQTSDQLDLAKHEADTAEEAAPAPAVQVTPGTP